MYKVSQNYLKTIYSGEAINTLYLSYDNEEMIDATPIVSSFKYISRVSKEDSKTLRLNSFFSKRVSLSIYNFDLLDISKEFYFEIGTLVDGVEERVPLGYFKINESPSNYYGKTKFTLYDRAINFDYNWDASELIKVNGGNITYLQAVEDMCAIANIELATKDFPRNNQTFGIYDNTLTARKHLEFIAERCGCFISIGRDGKLYFIPINQIEEFEFDENLLNNKLEFSNGIHVSRVSYQSGIVEFNKGYNYYDTYYVDSANPYIFRQKDIDDIYNDINGFYINSVSTNDIMGNPALDPWDMLVINIHAEDGHLEYTLKTLAEYEMNFKGAIRQNIKNEFTQVYIETNKTASLPSAKFKRIRQEIDETNATLKVVAEQVDDVEKTTQVIKNATGNQIEIFDAGNYDMLELLIAGNREGITGNIELFFRGEQEVEAVMITENNKKVLTEDNREIIVYVPNYQRLYLDIFDTVLYELDGVADTYNVITGIITKRVDKNNRGELYILDNPYEVEVEPIKLQTYKGHNYIYVYGNPSQLSLNYLTDSYYNQHFSTKAELYIASDEIKTSIRGEFQDELKSYTKTTEMNNIIDQKVTESENSIKSEVSNTYITKTDSATNINNAKNEAINSSNNSTDEKLKSYSTTTQMNNAITQKITESENTLKSEISTTYITKVDSATNIGNAINEAVSTSDGNTDEKLKSYSTTTQMNNSISQSITGSENKIMIEVNKKTTIDEVNDVLKNYETTEEVNAKLELKVGTSDNDQVVAMINASADEINLNSNRFSLNSSYLKINKNGLMEFDNTTDESLSFIKMKNKSNKSDFTADAVTFENDVCQSSYGNGYAGYVYDDSKTNTYQELNLFPSTINMYNRETDGEIFIRETGIDFNDGTAIYHDVNNTALTINSSNSSDIKAGVNGIWLGAGGNVTLNPGDNFKAYVRLGKGSSYAISTAGGNISSANLKNIKDKFEDVDYNEALKLLDYINLYHYDYKYKINDYDNNYGFIIDELEENELTKKFFNFEDNRAVITENNTLDEELATREDNQEEVINYKRYDNDVLIKYLLTVCKAQQKCIENLQNDVNDLKSILSKEN